MAAADDLQDGAQSHVASDLFQPPVERQLHEDHASIVRSREEQLARRLLQD